MNHQNFQNKIVSLTVLAGFLLTGCSLPAPDAVKDQPTVGSETQQTTVKNEPAKVYVSEKYDFKVDYPASWNLLEKDGLIFTPNDDPADKQWGGTNLNIQTEYHEGDVGMGWTKIKDDTYKSQSGLAFDLSFYTFDQNFNPEEKLSEKQKAERMILIGTHMIPGLVMFSYNEKINPNGEADLHRMLDGIGKKNQEQ